MLTRYTVIETFTLDGDLFIKGSTFINDDEIVGELLRRAGLLSLKPKMFSISVVDDPYQSHTYLTQMNKVEMLKVAENEGIKIDPKWSKRQVLAEIKRVRALRGENKR